MQVVAISPDPPEDSRALSERLGIDFPLLSDPEHRFAKQYVGLSTDGYPYPGIFIVDRERQIVFQRRSEAKDDRVYAQQLLKILDSQFGFEGAPTARGYERDFHLQAQVGLGAHRQDGDKSFAAALDLAALYSLGDYVDLGAELGGLALGAQEVNASALVRGKLPFWKGLGAVYLELPLGLGLRLNTDAEDKTGWHHGIALGVSFEGRPGRYIFTQVGVETIVYDGVGDDDYTSSTRLMAGLGTGWSF